MPIRRVSPSHAVPFALCLSLMAACTKPTGTAAGTRSLSAGDATSTIGAGAAGGEEDDLPAVSRGAHYQTGKECIKSKYAEEEGKCLTFPAPADDLRVLPKRNTTFFHYIGAGPLESPLEWVDVTNGVLALYDYRWKNWGPCIDTVLRGFGEKHGHFTTYFRTRDGMAKYKNPESDGKFGEDHDFGHSNKRSFLLHHNHISFNAKPWTAELFAEFIGELKHCKVSDAVATELVEAFKRSEQAKNPVSASNSCSLK